MFGLEEVDVSGIAIDGRSTEDYDDKNCGLDEDSILIQDCLLYSMHFEICIE